MASVFSAPHSLRNGSRLLPLSRMRTRSARSVSILTTRVKARQRSLADFLLVSRWTFRPRPLIAWTSTRRSTWRHRRRRLAAVTVGPRVPRAGERPNRGARGGPPRGRPPVRHGHHRVLRRLRPRRRRRSRTSRRRCASIPRASAPRMLSLPCARSTTASRSSRCKRSGAC